MLGWIVDNKEWLLSGAAISIPIALIGWWLAARGNAKQHQTGGDNSRNIQVGRDFSPRYGNKKDD